MVTHLSSVGASKSGIRGWMKVSSTQISVLLELAWNAQNKSLSQPSDVILLGPQRALLLTSFSEVSIAEVAYGRLSCERVPKRDFDDNLHHKSSQESLMHFYSNMPT